MQTKHISLFLIALSGLLVFSCMQDPSSIKNIHYQSEGVVVIEPEVLDTTALGWKVKDYYTGKGLESDTTSASFTIPISFSKPGTYYVWYLGRPDLRKQNDGEFSLAIDQSQTDVTLDSVMSLEWQNASVNGNRASLAIEKQGIKNLLVKTSFKSLYIDKIILAESEDFKPVGYGPVATTSPETLPLTEQNNQEIVLPPYWAFGVLYGGYTNQDESIDRVQKLLKGDYPIDAYWIDSWFWDYTNKGDGPGGYMNFNQDQKAFPNPEKMWKLMGDNGIRSGIWIWNAVLQKGNEETYKEFEEKGFFSGTYLERNGWHNKGNNSMAGNIDFENPEAVAFYKSKLKPYFDLGLDFVKTDRSSAIPFTKAAFEMAQEYGKQTKGRGFVLAHVHSTYNPEFKKYPTKWTGDAKIDWDQPDYPNMFRYAMGAYKENVDMVSNSLKTAYDVPFMAHDAGGYSFFGPTKVDEELYIRWTQFSAFSPIMTLFSAPANPTANMPFNFSKQVQTSFKTHAQLRHRLFPYIYTYAHLTRSHQKRLIVGDEIAKNQFSFGDAFFVAPVVEKGSTKRSLHLPDGFKWINYWTEERVSAGKMITVDAPLSQLPLFVKSGSIIPMKPYTQTLDKNFTRDLEIHYYNADESTSFTLFEDDGLSNAYQAGEIAQTTFEAAWVDGVKTFIIYAIKGNYENMPKTRDVTLVIHQAENPSEVEVDSNIIKTVSFNEKSNILTIKLGEITTSATTRIRMR